MKSRALLRRASAVLVAVILAACASVQNTPQQDLVWSAYNQCKADGRVRTDVQLVRVEADGRAWYSSYSSAYGVQQLERCLTDRTSSSSTAAPVQTNLPVLSL